MLMIFSFNTNDIVWVKNKLLNRLNVTYWIRQKMSNLPLLKIKRERKTQDFWTIFEVNVKVLDSSENQESQKVWIYFDISFLFFGSIVG